MNEQHMLSLSNPLLQRNLVSPIFRLPPETLEIIFIHGARDYHERNHYTTFRTPRWVNVSYVCRHWRNVALECATLWTYHFTVSLSWTKELLARSGQASLKIGIYFRNNSRHDYWWSSIVNELLKHAERIQELCLHVPATVLPAKISSFTSRLHNLEVTLVSNFLPDPEWSSVLTGWDIPSLRTLKLACCPLPWSSSKLKELTVLSLRQTLPSLEQKLVDFIAVLSCMQGLVDLHLEDALASTPGFLSTSALNVSSKICLPRLARLLVIAPPSTVVGLLSCVDVPTKTEVRLIFKCEYRLDDYVPISSLFAQRFNISEDPSLSSPIIRSLTIESTSYGPKFTFSTLERDCNPHSPTKFADWGCNIPLKAVIKVEISNSAVDRIISDICCFIPPTNVQSLHVVNPPYSLDLWRKVLGHLQGLRYMKLSQGYMPDLACMLAVASDESSENASGHITCEQDSTLGDVFLPALEELELDRITFLSTGSSGLRSATYQKSLFDALSTRKMSQDRVTMINCNVDG